MESRVIFRDRQEAQAKDFNSLQDYASSSFNTIVKEGITDEAKFTGFGVTATTTTDVEIATGRFFNSGDVYAKTTTTDIALFSFLPIATRRKVAIVVFGTEEEAQTEPRDFLIDKTTRETEPQAVPMVEQRKASLNAVGGVESADPIAPTVPDNSIVVAIVTMDTTGIESIEYQVANTLPNAKDNAQGIVELQNWRERLGPQLEAIQTSITGLEDKTDDKADGNMVLAVAADVANIREQIGLPDTFSLSGSDAFGDNTETDEGAGQYDAIIDPDGGVNFPHAASVSAALTPFNPIDTAIKRDANDWVLPAYTEDAKLIITGYSGDISISQYQVQSNTIKKFTKWNYRWRWSWGWRSRFWWRYHGFTYYRDYRWRWRGNWWRRFPTTVYKNVTTTESFNGVIVGQTWLASQSFWMTSVDMNLTQVAPSGDVQVVVCETDYGQPNIEKVVSSTTVSQADLQKYPTATKVPMPVAVIEAGKRYATMFITEGAHRMATVSGNEYTQGTYFYGNDGDYFTGDITRNLMFTVNGAVFAQPRTELVLNSVSLSGGMTDLDIITESQIPDGASLSFEVQIGGRWYPLEEADIATAQPDILPVRAIMLGTRDVAPGFQLGTNRLIGSRPKTAMTHVSTLRDLPGADTTDDVTVNFYLTGYDDTDHTVTVRLLNAANAPVATADATTTVVEYSDDEEVVTKITSAFNTFAPAVDEYKIEIVGTRDVAARPFHLVQRTDVAVPV